MLGGQLRGKGLAYILDPDRWARMTTILHERFKSGKEFRAKFCYALDCHHQTFLNKMTRWDDIAVDGQSRYPIRFILSNQAALHNAKLLASVDCNLGCLIEANSTSTLGFGSEFRGVGELRPLLPRHPHFTQLKELLKKDMSYVFT